jgi:integrase
MHFYEELLKLDADWRTSEYASIQRWIHALNRKGSVSTLRAYFKLMAWFIRFSGVSPDDFTKLPKDDMASKVQDFCDKFSDEGKKSTALNAMKALRSFLKANKFKLEEFQLDASYSIMKRPEYVPSKNDVYRMASACDLKWSAIVFCLFQSGLRNSALRALNYRTLKDQLEGTGYPINVHVTGDLRRILPDACKENVDYWTFFGREASEALRRYIAWRKEKYGKIDDDELLFPSEARTLTREVGLRKPMDQWHLTRLVKKTARKAGIKDWRDVRAHSLRKTFRAMLDAGYVDGGQMAEDDKEYIMGHRLPGNKSPYHNANVDTLAQRYMKLNWAPASQMTKEAKVDMIHVFAKSLGIDELELKIRKAREKQPEVDEMAALGNIIKQELGIKQLETRIVMPKKHDDNNNHKKYESKIVEEKELLSHIDDGWEIVKELKSGKLALRRILT